jgi:hypothetical protein
MSKLGDVRLRLDLLGGFGLALDGNPPRPIPISSRKARAVLAYAAMHPKHGVDRDRLASLLWGIALTRSRIRTFGSASICCGLNWRRCRLACSSWTVIESS